MKIKKSRLKAIILEEISSYAADIKSYKLLVEATLPGNQELIKKIEKLYFEKFGKKMVPPSEMEQKRARQEMDEDGTYLLWNLPDDVDKFRWVAYHYILGTDAEDFAEGDIEHFASQILPKLGSEKFFYFLNGISGAMIRAFPWDKKYTPPDRRDEKPIPEYLNTFSNRVYDKYKELEKEKEDLSTTQGIKPPAMDSDEDTNIGEI